MFKKFLLAGLVILIMLGVAIWQFSKKLTFSGKSEVTINGKKTTTYSAVTYYDELNEKVRSYYDTINVKFNDLGESELNTLATQGLQKLDEIEQFVNSVDQVKGVGSEELKASTIKWIGVNRTLLATTLPELAKTVGEDGDVETNAQVAKANELLNTWLKQSGDITIEFNNARDKFFKDNHFKEKL